MPTELGTAYISISGRTDGLRADIEKALNGVEKSGSTHGKNYGNAFGSGASTAMAGAGGASAARFTDSFQREANTRATRIGSAVGTLLGGAVVGAAGVAVAGLGGVLFKGLDRYRSIDKTAKRLGAMGKTSDQIKTVMDGINDAIKGTPIALDEAADSATKFLSGGVKEGKPLNDIMLAIADAAGASGQSFGDLATIFGQVMNKGKLQAEEMNQLNERGINIQAALRDEFGLTKDQLTQLSADGKITFEQLLQAVEGSFGGMAKAAGNSIDGAITNVKTSVARLGANFLSAIFGDPLSTTEGPGAMAEAINNIGVKIDGLNNWVTAHQGEIKQFFTDAAETAKDLANAVGDVLGFLKEHPAAIGAVVTAFAAWKTIAGVAALSTALNSINTLLAVTLPASAATGAAGVTSALAGIVWPAGLATLGGLAAGTAGSNLLNNGQNVPTLGSDGTVYDPNAPGGAGGTLPGGGGGSLPRANRRRDGTTATPDPTGGLLSGPLTGGGPALPSPASIAGIAKAQALNGMPYMSGTTDCSGYVSQVYSAMVGRNVHFTTMADFESLGFRRGFMPGALNIGNIPRPGNAGHMAATLPNGVNIESGGGGGGVRYGSGPGAMGEQFTEQWYFMPGMASGGGVNGPGSGTSDSIPAWLSNGEHVLTTKDVAAMGGQQGVYAFRNALHRQTGGAVATAAIPPGDPRARAGDPAYDPRQGKRKGGGRGYPPSWWPWGIPGTRRPSWNGDIPWWQFPGGKPPGFAEGGAVGPVNGRQLTPEQLQWLQGQGIDPATIMMGGDPPTEMPGAQEFIDSQPSADATGRTQGYIPAGAGYTGKTGGGVAGGFFNLAAEGINGAIDMAAQAASMGAGIAAPGAGAGIGIGADMAKRGVSFLAELGGIGVGALAEIALPFGAPRWLSDVDPTSFMPHTGVQAAGTTTAEQAVLDQQAQGSQVDPNTMQHGQGMGAPPGPTDPAAFIPPTPPIDPAAMTPAEVRGGDTINLYPKDVDESFRLLNQRQKLNAMQYGGRP